MATKSNIKYVKREEEVREEGSDATDRKGMHHVVIVCVIKPNTRNVKLERTSMRLQALQK